MKKLFEIKSIFLIINYFSNGAYHFIRKLLDFITTAQMLFMFIYYTSFGQGVIKRVI